MSCHLTQLGYIWGSGLVLGAMARELQWERNGWDGLVLGAMAWELQWERNGWDGAGRFDAGTSHRDVVGSAI
jgi:hypothetical protein